MKKNFDLFKKVAEFFELQVEATNEELENAIDLVEGDVSWNVDIGGQVYTWFLKYKDQTELPISNSDHFSYIRYKGSYYRIKRVFSDIIWLTPKVSVVDSEEK